jgi:hypothetical protein
MFFERTLRNFWGTHLGEGKRSSTTLLSKVVLDDFCCLSPKGEFRNRATQALDGSKTSYVSEKNILLHNRLTTQTFVC